MATLNEVKQRITGVRNTQKITKAMKIVAATKLKKHERAKKESSFFSEKVVSLFNNTIKYSYHVKHPLIERKSEVKKLGIVVIGSDRGLCGGFNSNLLRKTAEVIKEIEEKEGKEVLVFPIGKRVHAFFKKEGAVMPFYDDEVEKADLRGYSRELADKLVSAFMDGTVDEWEVIANKFESRTQFGFSRNILFPFHETMTWERDDSLYYFEDDVDDVLNYLMPLYISDCVYKVILESQTAEELSRMLAMDYATENAETLIGDLTLFYNRTRQQVITKELSEIVAGAEALK